MGERGRLIWVLAFAAFALLGLAGSLSTPLVSGPDEFAHAIKAAAVVRGEVQTDVVWRTDGFGRRIPDTKVEVPQGYGSRDLFLHRLCWQVTGAVDPRCSPDLAEAQGTTTLSQTYVGTYPPLYYAVTGIPTLLLPPAEGLRTARVLTALVTAAFLASAVWASLRLGGRLSTSAVLLAVTPSVLYFAGVINPSAPEIAAALSLWTSLLVIAGDPRAPRAVVAQAGLSAMVLAGLRPLGPALVVAVGAAVGIVAIDRGGLGRLWRRRSVRWATVGTTAVWVISVVYVVVTRAATTVMTDSEPDRSSILTLLSEGVRRLGSDAREQVGLIDALGFGALWLPEPLVWAWGLLVVIFVAVALVVGSWRERAGLALTTMGSLSVGVLATASAPDVSWQARYSLALTIGIPVVAGWIIDRSRRVPRTLSAASVVLVALLSAGASLDVHRRWTRRVLFDYPDSVAGRVGDPLWDALASVTVARLVAVLGAAATVALGVTCARLATRQPTGELDPSVTSTSRPRRSEWLSGADARP